MLGLVVAAFAGRSSLRRTQSDGLACCPLRPLEIAECLQHPPTSASSVCPLSMGNWAALAACRSGPGPNCGLPAECFGGKFTADGETVQCQSAQGGSSGSFAQQTTQQPAQTSIPGLSSIVSGLGFGSGVARGSGGTALIDVPKEDPGNSVSINLSTATISLVVALLAACCCCRRNEEGNFVCVGCGGMGFGKDGCDPTLFNPLQTCLGGEDFEEIAIGKQCIN